MRYLKTPIIQTVPMQLASLHCADLISKSCCSFIHILQLPMKHTTGMKWDDIA